MQPTVLDDGDGDAEDWIVLQPGWWCTPFSSIPWAFPSPGDQPSSRPKVESVHRVYAKPPHYHGALFLSSYSAQSSPQAPSQMSDGGGPRVVCEDMVLNPELVGVRAAGDVLTSYEVNVGFYYPGISELVSEAPKVEERPPLDSRDDKGGVALCRERWDELVHNLTGGLVLDEIATDSECSPTGPCFSDFSPQSSVGSLHRTFSSIDLTDSEHSTQSMSMPATPKARSAVIATDVSPTSSDSGLLSRPLNAAASTFVPSSHSLPMESQMSTATPSPIRDGLPSSFFEFTFPSISQPTPKPPVVKITKDEQGFVTEVHVAEATPALASQSKRSVSPVVRPSSALLPPFLHEPSHRRKVPASKTRAIVDQLRSLSNQNRDDWLSTGERNTGLVSEANAKASQSASHSPTPSPSFYDTDLFRPRSSVSDDGGDRHSAVSTIDDDGWIGLDDMESSQGQTLKTKRSRELLQALGRHRGPSTPEDRTNSGVLENKGTTSTTSPSPAPSSHGGWIEGSSVFPVQDAQTEPKPQPTSKKNSGKRHHPSSSSSSLAHSIPLALPPMLGMHMPQFTLAQYPPGPLPHMYPPYSGVLPAHYAAYMMQMQMRLQMQSGVVPSLNSNTTGEWYGYLPLHGVSNSIGSVPKLVPPVPMPNPRLN